LGTRGERAEAGKEVERERGGAGEVGRERGGAAEGEGLGVGREDAGAARGGARARVA
jgi:hypothetical protein